MIHYALIVAGGKGHRMGENTPKQFLLLNGKPVLMHTLEAFYSSTKNIELLLVISKKDHKYWVELCNQHHFTIPHILLEGGEQRFHSVKNGLNFIFDKEKDISNVFIAIHDGVRPLVSNELIERAFDTVYTRKCVVPALQCTDSVRIEQNDEHNLAFPREKVYTIQTPQVFSAEVLKTAFDQEYDQNFTDDASVVEKSGYPIHFVGGDIQNIKITYPADLELASFWKKLRVSSNHSQ